MNGLTNNLMEIVKMCNPDYYDPKYGADFRELIGSQILRVYLSPDKTELSFDTDNGFFMYQVFGDCCSHSWFNDIINVQALLGETVESVEERSMPEAPQEEDGYIQVYGLRLTTRKGWTDIAFRNSSDGYYGGWMSFAGKNPPNKNWKKVLEDIGD